jgi:hypothetical protein
MGSALETVVSYTALKIRFHLNSRRYKAVREARDILVGNLERHQTEIEAAEVEMDAVWMRRPLGEDGLDAATQTSLTEAELHDATPHDNTTTTTGSPTRAGSAVSGAHAVHQRHWQGLTLVHF